MRPYQYNKGKTGGNDPTGLDVELLGEFARLLDINITYSNIT